MLKKILQLIVVLFFTATGVMAQTVQVENATRAPGDILVQVDMLSYTDVAAITLNIGFDSDLMDFTGISNTTIAGDWVANYNSNLNQVMITYTSTPGIGFNINGKLLDLMFFYKGGFSTDLTFFESTCEIADKNLAPIPSTYINGSVTQLGSDGTVSMADLTDQTIGNTLLMPVTIGGGGFGAVDAITLKIAFDPAQLAYAGKVEHAITGVTATANSGVLTINWIGSAIDFTTLATLLDIKFVYYGGNAAVTFIPGCEIASGLTLLPTTYVDGSFTPKTEVASLTIDDVAGVPGSAVSVPIIASGFGVSQLGTMALNISYDISKLTYTGYTVQQLAGGWVTNGVSGGVISLQWSSSSGPLLADGNLLTLNFTYAGGGQAVIEFAPGSEVKSVNLVTIPVTFNDGFVDIGHTVTFTVEDQNAVAITDAVITFDGTTYPAGTYVFTDLLDGTYAYSVAKVGYKTVTGSVVVSGANVTEPIVLHVYSVANVKVFLQGAYDAINLNMKTTLNLNSFLPLSQPYSGAPWNYAGTESVTSVPATAVDWVLIEIRTGTTGATKVATRAAFVLSDGSVVDMDGTSLVEFLDIAPSNYYIVVKHRFHLAIMSASAQALSSASTLFDFTSSSSQSYGLNPVKSLAGGSWGMYSGDGNADGIIFPTDVTLVYLVQANQSGYKTGDWNMDGIVFPTDVTLIYLGNANKSTQVPN